MKLKNIKYISDKEETFEKIDIIHKTLKYQTEINNKDEITGKELWEDLYEAIPYKLILKNEEILDLIVNMCKDNYNENLNLLKNLINEYYCNEKKSFEEKIEDGVKFDVKKSLDILNQDQYDVSNSLKKSGNIGNEEENRDVTTNGEYESLDKINAINGELIPHSTEVTLSKIVRNSTMVRILKKIYKDTCQLCGTRLKVSPNVYYSEVHHIRPLGKLHKGSDTTNNLIVLCPNCHTLFDRGSIGIDIETMSIINFDKNNTLNGVKAYIKHELDLNNIKYHNYNIYINGNRAKKINNEEIEHGTINKYLKSSISESINDVVDYGDVIKVLDLDLDQIIIVNMKSYWEQNDVPPLQKNMINKRNGDIVKFNEYVYKIVEIKK